MDDIGFEALKNTMRKMICITRMHRNIFERKISSMGIHHSEHHMLMYLAKEGEILSQKQIAEKFGVSPAAIARQLKGLEADGYIERSNIEGDGRFNKIVITDKGKNVVANSHNMFMEIDMDIFSDLSEEEIENLNVILDKIYGKLAEKNCERSCAKRDEKENDN